jgi:hypothetical protein
MIARPLVLWRWLSFLHLKGEESSFVKGTSAAYLSFAKQNKIHEQEMTMSTIAMPFPGQGLVDALPRQNIGAGFSSRVLNRLYRFMVKLPETQPDVDIEVFKRIPVPV